MHRHILASLIVTALVLTGCASRFAKPMHWMPHAIEREQIRPIAPWAGTPVRVEDGRPEKVLRVSWVDAGLTWELYSAAVVQETQRALLDALGPARAETPAELHVTIREHGVRFDAPNWIGATVLEAEVLRGGQATDQRWMARGQAIRWNWNGMRTADLANHRAYEAAVHDLLRQIALSRPPQP